jgi:hypothetical protein
VWKKSLDSCFYERKGASTPGLPPEVEILTYGRVPFQHFVCLQKSAVLLHKQHEQLENRENQSLGIPFHTMCPKIDLSILSMSMQMSHLLDLPCHLHITVVLKLTIQTRCYTWGEREI